jgi:tRNA 5-methylaminomethyl-2-thiouridine biosynthesis bifunctional protein
MTVTPAILGDSPSGQAPGVPYSPVYDDVYHAVAGAWAQAQHVFLGGNGLPGRWRERTRFVILETGFGLGNNFLATWSAWLQDSHRCQRLVFISIEKHPLRREDMQRVHGLAVGPCAHAQRDCSDTRAAEARHHATLATRLIEAWPPLTPGLHTLHFDEADGSGVSLMLGLGDVADLLPSLSAQVDAFYLDGFAPAKNLQMWDAHLLSRLNRLAASECTAATWSAARGVRDALTLAGFQVGRVPGFAGKRDMIRAVYRPRFTPHRQPGGLWPAPSCPTDRHAIVLGAGLAGCGAAWALCRQGWRVTLVDRHAGPAQEASGNPGGLFHGVLHGEDGLHARAHRAAALSTWRWARPRVESGRVAGQTRGLLRLDGKVSDLDAQALIDKLHLPTDYVQWLPHDLAQTCAGLAVPSGGWLFHQAGWLHPGGMAQVLLDEAAAGASLGQGGLDCLWNQSINHIEQQPDGTWQLRSGERVMARAPTLVLCTAMGTTPLLDALSTHTPVSAPPLAPIRGQITRVEINTPTPEEWPHLPVAGAGYVLPLSDREVLCGATTQHHDDDPNVRETDHHHNLGQAARLGMPPSLWQPNTPDAPRAPVLQGRVGWRAATPDRLPVIGALPWSVARLQSDPVTRRLDQVRLVPRWRDERGGLFVLSGLGSRGITWSILAAELLAHWVTGAPCPVENDLRDALDPARFLVREISKAARLSPPSS